MKSPFPGMDPYLEPHWGDVHTRLMVYASKQINEQLPDDLQARIIEEIGLELEDEPRTRRHIKIVEWDGGRVVTAIEILSPANKQETEGRVAYLRKQGEYLQAGINLVEIDLIREGEFILAAPQHRIPPDFRTPYLICIRRAARIGRVEVYRVPLRERLPNIPIPLRPTDKAVALQLQPLIDECYRGGRYHRTNYRAEPAPRLGETDALWADQLLRQRGLR